jgi:Ca-activated chloride channel family protein
MLMLDASYSMLRTVARTVSPTRFSVARDALAGITDRYPLDGYLALRLYGSQSSVGRRDCTDTTLAVPFGRGPENRLAVKRALAATHARGVTPIALALQQAIADFSDPMRERLIVIVTDGGESCDGDPCATALGMAAQGFVIDTVGFLINDALSREQLQCMARVTHGSYVDVQSYLDLPDKLANLLSECAIAALPRRQDGDDRLALGEAMAG